MGVWMLDGGDLFTKYFPQKKEKKETPTTSFDSFPFSLS
jgi:hypothetical protein